MIIHPSLGSLKPKDEKVLFPNVNLLSWRRSERLTLEQRTAYERRCRNTVR